MRHQHAVPRPGHQPAAEARAIDSPGPELCRRVGAGGNGSAPPQQYDRRPRGRAREDRHLAPLRLRDRVLRLSRQAARLLDDLHHADAAGPGANRVDLPGRQRPRLGRHLLGAHRAAHGVGDRDLPVPAVLPDHSRFTRRGGAARRRRPAPVPVVDPPAPVDRQHRRAVRDPVRLRLERLPLAAHDHEQPGDANGRDRDRRLDTANLAAARMERRDGRGHDGPAAAGGDHRRHAAVVRERPDRDREVTRIAAHRGGAALWPENSLLAFQSAIAIGCDLLELDVHLTRDRNVAVIHDATLERTSNGSGPVASLTAAELGRLRLCGPGKELTSEPVPMLDDVLALAAGAPTPVGLLVEVKESATGASYDGIEELIVTALTRARLQDRATIMAFDRGVITRVRALAPRMPTSFLVDREAVEKAGARPEQTIDWAAALGASDLGLQYTLADERVIARAREARIALGVWTVNDAASIRRMLGMG